jgi:spore maturation protein CgeB
MLVLKEYFSRFFPFRSRQGPYVSLKIALISDALTQASLQAECLVRNVTPQNYVSVLRDWKPDLLFVESAWQGYRDSWRYKLAAYPEHPERTNAALVRVLAAAKECGVPAVFWNKEDNVHYSRFIDTAALFDNIYTVDSNCIEKYREDVPRASIIECLMFPVQPRFHYLKTQEVSKKGSSCFVGSYGKHVHPRRRQWQDMLFQAFAPGGLDIYDRNSGRKAKHYRYPEVPGVRVRNRVPYEQTADLYRRYQFNLNVNTIEQSPTMYSRRLIEILAVGGVAVSSPSQAASALFSDFCEIVGNLEEVEEIIHWSGERYRSAVDRAHAGAQVVAKNHTWSCRLQQIEQASLF